MAQGKDSEGKFSRLRKRVEATLSREPPEMEDISGLSPEELQRLVHELRVHRIELEVQNEELRQAQVKLEELKDRYLDLYDFAPVGYVTLNEKGLILEANLTAVRLLRVERRSLTKMFFSRFVCPELGGTYYLHLQQVLETQSKQTCEIKLARDDGTHFFAQLETVAVQNETGQFNRFRTVLSDITERREAEEALQEAKDNLEARVEERTAELENAKEAAVTERQRLYDVLETLPVYVCLLDSDYHMPFANRYFRETFGEPRGRRCYDFLFDRTEPCETCDTYTVMKTRAPHHWYWTGPNGRYYDIYDFPFIDTDGSFLILEMGIDITERKQAEDDLKQTLGDLTRSNADLEYFAYVASHDLQEPLRTVAVALQVLEKRQKGKLGPDSDQLIHYAVDASQKMKALITDLLTYSRLTSPGRPFAALNIQKILDQSILNLKSLIEERGTEITYGEMPTVQGEATQLLLVFQNLIGNAVKFGSSELPKVHISARKEANEWVFAVKDSGIGIDNRYFDRIFTIFQQLNKKGNFEGTGMGLSIVKKVIERHRGRVWVESEVGAGSTFYFTIPDGSSK